MSNTTMALLVLMEEGTGLSTSSQQYHRLCVCVNILVWCQVSTPLSTCARHTWWNSIVLRRCSWHEWVRGSDYHSAKSIIRMTAVPLHAMGVICCRHAAITSTWHVSWMHALGISIHDATVPSHGQHGKCHCGWYSSVAPHR